MNCLIVDFKMQLINLQNYFEVKIPNVRSEMLIIKRIISCFAHIVSDFILYCILQNGEGICNLLSICISDVVKSCLYSDSFMIKKIRDRHSLYVMYDPIRSA